MDAIAADAPAGAAWALCDHIHATAVDDDLVLLDLAADTYLCVPAGAAEVEISEGGSEVCISRPELAADLHAAGLVRPLCGAERLARRRRAEPPTASALELSYPLPVLGDVPQLASAVLDVALAYRGRALSGIVSRRIARRTGGAAPTLEQTLERFQRWVPYAPVSGKCLLRAFMLRRLLHRNGHDHHWVFGVTVWPFKAHCWLQAGGLVLDDTLENVAAYRPIMVV